MSVFNSRGWRGALLCLPFVIAACSGGSNPVDPGISANAGTTSPASPLVNTTVTFSGASCSGGSDGLSSQWDYGDKTSGILPSHVYTEAGTYTATLSCSDSAGQLKKATVSVTVTSPVAGMNCASTKDSQGWCWQYAYPVSDNIVATSMVSSSTGWAITSSGGILYTATTGATFSLQYMGAAGQSVNFINAVDASAAWAVIGSSVLKTSNAGKLWSSVSYPTASLGTATSSPIIGMSAIDAENVWLLTTTATTGVYDVLQTTNGGSSWSAYTWALTGETPTAFSARTMGSAWVAGAGGGIYNIDISSGISVSKITTLQDPTTGSGAHLNAIRAYSDNTTVWVAGNHNLVWQTPNAGQNWIQTSAPALASSSVLGVPSVDLVSLSVPDSDPGTAYVVGTVPGTGLNLDLLLPSICPSASTACARQASFPDNSLLFVTNNSGNIWTMLHNWTGSALMSLDSLSGSTWGLVKESQYDARAIFASGSSTAFAVGNEGDWFSISDTTVTVPNALDTGNSRVTNAPNAGIRDVIYSVAASDAATAWAVSGSGTVIHTSNGGASWATQSLPNLARLTSVSYANNTVWVAGPAAKPHRQGWPSTSAASAASPGTSTASAAAASAAPSLFRSVNGGNNWIAINNNNFYDSTGKHVTLTGDVFSISAANSYTAWAVGQDTSSNPLILYTNNGGATWTEQTVPSSVTRALSAVYAVNATTVWIVGQGGVALRTTNAGASWTAQSLTLPHPTVDLTSVAATDANTVWITAADGSILHGTEGSSSMVWTVQTSGTTQYLSQICSVDANTLWAVGMATPGSAATSVILHTTNGGSLWTAQTSGTQQPLLGVFAVDGNNAWIVGGGNTVLRTASGGK